MNAILLDACNFSQTEAEGLKCKETLQVNEIKLFAASVKFLNTTALTHLSYNVVTNRVIDVLYNPVIKRGTLTYLNRLRVSHFEDNDEKLDELEKVEEVLKAEKPTKEKKKNNAFLQNNRVSSKRAEEDEASGNRNLWGQPTDKAKEKQRMIQEQKALHPSLNEQLKRITTESPRIEHFAMKWRRLRKDKTTFRINDAFLHLKQLSILRTLYIGTCTFDYCHFVQNLPPFVEQLTLRTTYCSSYKQVEDGKSPERIAPLPTFPLFLGAISKYLPRLKTLRMHDAQINGDADFSAITDHRCLTTIIIEGNERFSKKSFNPETLPPTLLHLRLTKCELRGELDFSKFPPSLTHLNLHDNQFKGPKKGDADLSELPQNLQFLSLDGVNYLKIHLPVENLPRHLRVLYLNRAYCYGPLEFSKLPIGLTHFSLSKTYHSEGSVTPIPVEKLSDCPVTLRHLDLTGIHFTGTWSWNFLPPLLEKLDLTNCQFQADPDRSLNLAKLPCVDSIEYFSVASCTGINGPDADIVISSRAKKLRVLNLRSVAYSGIKFADEKGEVYSDTSLINKTNAFPQNLSQLNLTARESSTPMELFDLSLLPDSIQQFRAYKSKLTGSPDFTKLPVDLRVLDLSQNFLTSPVNGAPIKLDSLPHRLKTFCIERNKYKGSPIILTNLGPHLRILEMQHNSFDLTNSTFDTTNATRVKTFKIKGMKWDRVERVANIAPPKKRKAKKKKNKANDSTSWSSSSSDDDDDDDDDEDKSDLDDEGSHFSDVEEDLATGWPQIWTGEDEEYGDYDNTTQINKDYDEWTSEYTSSSSDDDDDESWSDDDDDDDSDVGDDGSDDSW